MDGEPALGGECGVGVGKVGFAGVSGGPGMGGKAGHCSGVWRVIGRLVKRVHPLPEALPGPAVLSKQVCVYYILLINL